MHGMPTNETEYPCQRNATDDNQIDQQMDLTTNSPPKQRLDLIFYRGRSKTYKGSNYYALLYNKPITAIETPIYIKNAYIHHDLRQRTATRTPRLQRHHRLATDQT